MKLIFAFVGFILCGRLLNKAKPVIERTISNEVRRLVVGDIPRRQHKINYTRI